MKSKYLVVSQIVFLAGAVIAGMMLNSGLTGGLRTAHRTFGMLAGLSGLAIAVLFTVRGHANKQKAFAWATAVFSLLAGFAGMQLKDTADYTMMFNLMRGSGVIALALSVASLVMLHKKANSSGN
jgi:hypothetical protein